MQNESGRVDYIITAKDLTYSKPKRPNRITNMETCKVAAYNLPRSGQWFIPSVE